jgi:phosphate transport system permease protein
MSQISRATLRRVKRRDRIARWVVTLGGVVVIVSVLGILVLIVGTTVPLFLPARARVLAETPLPRSISVDRVLGLGLEMSMNERMLVAHLIGSDGGVTFLDLADGKVIQRADVASAAGKTVRAVAPSDASAYTLTWSDGSVSLVDIALPPERDRAGQKQPKFIVATRATIPPEKEGVPRQAVIRRSEQGATTCAALLPGNRIVVTRQTTSEDLSGDETTKNDRIVLDRDIPGEVTALALDHQGSMLYAGTSTGALAWWRLGESRVAEHDVVPAFRDHRAVTSLGLMLGDMTLVVGDSEGGVTNWFFVRPEEKSPGEKGPAGKALAGKRSDEKVAKKLRLIRSLESHAAAIRDLVPSARNRELLVRDDLGGVSIDYTTSQRRLLSLTAGDRIERLAFAPRGDAVLAVDAAGKLTAWRILCPHPEVSWQTLWGRVFYEGYDKPDLVWQTTGGEEYEPKFSLVPLLFGTLKGTLYAMLLAVPLALGGAAYVSHFTTPAFRGWIKPAVEMMAAVPSVIIGFLVALWLAPRIETGLVALAVSFVSVPGVFLFFLLVWWAARLWPRAERVARSREFLFIAPVLVIGIILALSVASPLEHACFGGNVRLWLSKHVGMLFDPRNCILIGFGVGFMVIPIIFSLSEDALGNVPHTMTAASMALGASRWQTLWRVVLPSASPGIFAAVMIGFGRAVGETMVFLMATGNTAIIDWSPLDGMRTLSANIAVEIPEAPVGGTLYRVLFLCAVLLFVLTFFVNTVAEVVRQRLRKRFGQF